MKIAVLGGTGKLGLGFVARLSTTSHEIAIGSRTAEKAAEAAATFGDRVRGMANPEAAAWCDLAILTVPYAAHRDTVSASKEGLRGKIVIDATVPLNPANFFKIATESGNSAAEETRDLLDDAKTFAAFQTISHRILRKVEHSEDVLVAGNADGKDTVMQLIRELNMRPIDAGPIEAAGLLERMTVLLISINKQNKVKESGLKVTGV